MKKTTDTQPIDLLAELDRQRTRRDRVVRYTVFSVAALAGVGLAFGAAGIANAGTMPMTGNSIAMTIRNDTGQDMVLQGSDNPYGQWIHAPNATLRPGQSEIVTASNNDPSGLGVDVTYSLPGNAQAVFMANDYPGGTDTSGTRMTGPDGRFYTVRSTVDTGFPTMNAAYSLVMN